MAKVKPRVKVPKTAEIGEIIEIKTLISHPMHSGRAVDGDGNLCLLYTSPSPRDYAASRMPSSA